MQKYRPKSLSGSISDHILRFLLSCAMGIAWFVCLWGVRITAFLAGLALGGLIWLCIRQFTLQATRKHEKRMRILIGGELEVEKLLLLPPRQAGFTAALWLTLRFPLVMQTITDWGVIGMLNENKTMIHLIAQHESLPVNVQQIIEVQREMKKLCIQRCLLCLTAPPCKECLIYLKKYESSIRTILRNELIELAGIYAPATDEQLIGLKQKREKNRSTSEWIRIILNPNRARHYLVYGLALSAMAVATGQHVFPFPAALCLVLYLFTKLRSSDLFSHAGIGESDPFQHR